MINMKILFIALSGIGDALMFTPALKMLKESYPECKIDCLAMFSGAADIFKHNKNVDNIIRFDFLKEGALNSLNFLIKMRKKYNITINVYPSNRIEYNVINYLLGAEKRCAVNYNRKDFQNLGFLNNIRVKENDELHNVVENINLVEKLTGKTFNKQIPLELNITEFERDFADAYLNKLDIKESDIIIGIHPGCNTLKNHINRRWDTNKFAELANRLALENCKILVFGGGDEKKIKDVIVHVGKSEDIISIETETLLQTAAVIEKCNLFVTNDSSLMHVASAMKRFVVPIIGPTNTSYIHPWMTEYAVCSLNLDCSPCFFYSQKPLECNRNDIQYKCIKEITVDMVFHIVKNNLRKLNA